MLGGHIYSRPSMFLPDRDIMCGPRIDAERLAGPARGKGGIDMHRPTQRVVLLGVATLAILACLALVSAVTGGAAAATSPVAAAAKPAADWQMNATAIEACS